jgi:hypothetical protein
MQFVIFPNIVVLSRRIVNPTTVCQAGGSPLICCPRLQIIRIHNYAPHLEP